MNKDLPFIMICVGAAGVLYYGGLILIAIVAWVCWRALLSFLDEPEGKIDYRGEYNRRADEKSKRDKVKFEFWCEKQDKR